jgi:hypothetical protein
MLPPLVRGRDFLRASRSSDGRYFAQLRLMLPYFWTERLPLSEGITAHCGGGNSSAYFSSTSGKDFGAGDRSRSGPEGGQQDRDQREPQGGRGAKLRGADGHGGSLSNLGLSRTYTGSGRRLHRKPRALPDRRVLENQKSLDVRVLILDFCVMLKGRQSRGGNRY